MDLSENRLETSAIQLPSKVTQPPIVFGKMTNCCVNFFFVDIFHFHFGNFLNTSWHKKAQCLLGNSTLHKVKGIKKKACIISF